jgi:formylglycine-generating enzyme required for sulfatase activity
MRHRAPFKTAWPLIAFVLTACGGEQIASRATCPEGIAIATEVLIPAGDVPAAGDALYPEEEAGPGGYVDAFKIDATEVTNDQFAAFVEATGYVTIAEQMNADGVRNGAAVFSRATRQWRVDNDADWRHPEGRGSNIERRGRHPVVAVAYEDAEAYARWRGRRLPTEAEWERAARSDAAPALDIEGEIRNEAGAPTANIWTGLFPISDTGEDGFTGTAPVGCFSPNARGLYDMIGNVWEWTSDWYGVYERPETAEIARRSDSDKLPQRVIKGGSHLCARNLCSRFRSNARQPGDPGLGYSHIGFRTVGDAR